MKLYYQINPITGEILGLYSGRFNEQEFDYVREKDIDFAFFDVWRKTWSHVNPLLSELELYRRWKKADTAFRTVGDRPELQRRSLPGEAASSYFDMYPTGC